ncbi:MAG: 2-succinyl-5-enolpyruvyl-6-hydroxy-3-cyclohexene-1-carboxylic-acid synthase [Bacteroidetes bacterium]|nr:2-succinyl-5-enolpyruvyl-6-hydroxy-3-cyclohexene-1-carboxylic-acid synthase [Bacteroidota bacterium]
MQKSVNQLISHIYALGVRYVILCPGNRNAPVSLSFIRHKGFKCFSLVDERSAAYTALGIAIYQSKPVVIVCTSGTAVLNLYPAIAEAYYSQIPLIVITADRPSHLIDQWEGQCIRQTAIFEKHILASFTFDVEKNDNFDFKNNLFNCLSPVKGPIHINIPLEEPLYAKSDEFLYNNIKPYEQKSIAFTNKIPNEKLPSKILILAGADAYGQRLEKYCSFLSKSKKVVFIADILSGLHQKQNIKNWDFTCLLSSENEKQVLKPDLLITFGKIIVSKSLNQFLKKFKPQNHWHITPNGTIGNPFQTSPSEIKCSEEFFLSWIKNNISNIDKSYFENWEKISVKYDKKINKTFEQANFNEFSATRFILKNIEKNVNLFLSNSMPVRYASYLTTLCKISKIYCNRGVSGIDGTTSTAAGVSMVSKNNTVLITGDLSFFYDINGLWNKYLKSNYKIIVFNNNGGGIFRLIDGPDKAKERERYLTAPPNRNCKAIAENFNFIYFEANDFDSLNNSFKKFMDIKNSSAIFEIKFKPQNAVKFFKKLNLDTI